MLQETDTIAPRAVGTAPPLSFAQERLWFLTLLQPASPLSNLTRLMWVSGPLRCDVLEAAVTTLIERHEALRTRIVTAHGQATQAVADPFPMKIPLLDLSDLPAARQEAAVHQSANEEAQRPFDLAAAPLFRVGLLRLAPHEHVLLLTVHQIVADVRSVEILIRELGHCYRAMLDGSTPVLPALPVQFADFAVWQRERLRGEALDSQLEYWRNRLHSGPSLLELPTDHARPGVRSFRSSRCHFHLSKDLSQRLMQLSKELRVSLSSLLLSGLSVLLSRLSGQKDLMIGMPIINRPRPELQHMVGVLANTLIIRINLETGLSFRAAAAYVQDTVMAAHARQDLPVEQIIAALHPERDLSRHPLFQVTLQVRESTQEFLELPGLTITPLDATDRASELDLGVTLVLGSAGVHGTVEYASELWEAPTIGRWMQHFETLLDGIAADPDLPTDRLPLLTPAEEHRILAEWNDTGADTPSACVHESVARQAASTPHATAAVWGTQRMSYRELDVRANRLAHFLRKRGVGPEVLVGVYLNRTIDLIVCLLGILKAGGGYVPLDPAYPAERLAFILNDAKAPILLTQDLLVNRVPKCGAETICLNTVQDSINREPAEEPAGGSKPYNLAYVIYTSGSTGLPKGVCIEHRSTAAFVAWAKTVFSKEDLAGVLASTSICFDLSVFELFVPLSCGGTVILADNVLQLPAIPAANEVTLINTVPSGIAELLRLEGIPRSVRIINLAGEPLRTGLVRKLYQLGTVRRVFDLYGPSEDTTYSTYALRTAEGPATIGRPIHNTQVYILDPNVNPVPIGVTGELLIAGTGLSRGYLNRPAMTAERFIPNPFSRVAGSRMYRTGDLARYLPNGNIEFLGRRDHQVKVRGYRVELGEIESALRRDTKLQDAVVVAREDPAGDKWLVAYVVPVEEPGPSAADLRTYLLTKVPRWMVPAAFVFLKSLPMTPNGKIDRRALPPPEAGDAHLKFPSLPPHDPLETRLAKIWERVLGVRNIGIKDSFFDLGGDSLLAVQMIAQIEEHLGERIPLAAVFQSPSIEQLADTLRGRGWERLPSTLVPIQPRGIHPPFFMVIGPTRLSRYLGVDQPVYGLWLGRLEEAHVSTLTIEDLAALFLRDVRSIQSAGPYYLGGYSAGGVVAYEMAQQLRAKGERVGFLALFDAWRPGWPKLSAPKNILHLTAIRFARWIDHQVSSLALLSPEDRSVHLRAEGRKLLDKLRHRLGLAPRLPQNTQRVEEAFDRLLLTYDPKPYPGLVTLLRASKQLKEYESDLELGWGSLAMGEMEIEVHEVPGYHGSIVTEPWLRFIGEQLGQCLRLAQAIDRSGYRKP